MKPLFLLPITVMALGGCNENISVDSPRAIYIQSEIKNAGPDALVSTGYFWAHDKTYKIPATESLINIFNSHYKDTKFLTASTTQDMFQPGYCLVNETKYDYRVFCGTWDDYISTRKDEYYTVSVNKTMTRSEAYDQLQTILKGAENPVLVVGSYGDFIIKLPKTEQLESIYKRAHTRKFLSTPYPQRYVEDGYCLLNIVPYNTMKKLGTPDSTCHYRLFCGTKDNIMHKKTYAVELCGD